MNGHRNDIDGLRAVAILPVVLYHSGLPGFSGGFVGVDVFFVISGFLIAGIIQREIADGSFTIAGFYERRARRILPALFFVLAACSMAAIAILGPVLFERFADAVAAAILFGSNFLYLRSADYFATATEFRPLLHTWSLAVEEQFYLLFPLVMIAMAGMRHSVRNAWLIAGLLVSLLLCIVLTHFYPRAAFYLIFTRAWELLIGVCLALNVISLPSGQRVRSLAAAAGLALIAVALFGFTSETPFPGAAALLPAVGTGLILYAGQGGSTAVNRMLEFRPLVWIGLISYSLYLWHWPVFSFLRIAQGNLHLDYRLSLAAIAFSLVAALLSYRYIEQPFRRRPGYTRRQIVSFATYGSAAFILFSVSVHATGGATFRFDRNTVLIMNAVEDQEPGRRACRNRFPGHGLCRAGLDTATPSILVWGDSHVGATMSAIDKIAGDNGKAALLGFHTACPPLLGVRSADQSVRSESCVRFNEAIVRHIEENRADIDTVVLIARWAFYASATRLPGEPGRPIYLAKVTGERGPNAELFRYGLENTIRRLNAAGVRTVILGGIPEIGWNVPRRLATFNRLGLPQPAGPSLSDVEGRNAVADRLLRDAARHDSVEFLPTRPLLCGSVCRVIDNGRPLYVDDDHLSIHGAVNVLAPGLSARLRL